MRNRGKGGIHQALAVHLPGRSFGQTAVQLLHGVHAVLRLFQVRAPCSRRARIRQFLLLLAGALLAGAQGGAIIQGGRPGSPNQQQTQRQQPIPVQRGSGSANQPEYNRQPPCGRFVAWGMRTALRVLVMHKQILPFKIKRTPSIRRDA